MRVQHGMAAQVLHFSLQLCSFFFYFPIFSIFLCFAKQNAYDFLISTNVKGLLIERDHYLPGFSEKLQDVLDQFS